MSKERFMGALRHLLTFGGGYVVAQGVVDEGTMLEVVGALVTIGGVAWSIFSPEKKTT